MQTNSAKEISTAQIRMMYGLARKLGMDDEALHALVKTVTKRDSIRALSSWEGKQVTDRLRRLAGQDSGTPSGRATTEQIAKIYALARALGWTDDPARLKAFLEKRYSASHPRFLTDTAAKNAIEGMKAMLKGGRGERKGRNLNAGVDAES